MSPSPLKTIDVFMTLDPLTIDGYFNKHDPSPIYKRQLSHQFEDYIMASVKASKKHSVIFYKLKCTDNDKQFAEPLMYAIRGHFSEKTACRTREFKKFKRRSWLLLAISIAVVVGFHSLTPLLVSDQLGLHEGLINSVDIFSWVLLWHPIDELVFHWNPHLREINVLKKLATAEAIFINENSINTVIENILTNENERKFAVAYSNRTVSQREYAV